MGATYDRNAEIQTVLYRLNLGAAYSHNLIGNSYRVKSTYAPVTRKCSHFFLRTRQTPINNTVSGVYTRN